MSSDDEELILDDDSEGDEDLLYGRGSAAAAAAPRSACALCDCRFSARRRRHHCRGCRATVCQGCSMTRGAVEGRAGYHRLCDACALANIERTGLRVTGRPRTGSGSDSDAEDDSARAARAEEAEAAAAAAAAEKEAASNKAKYGVAWEPNSASKVCTCCQRPFSLKRRRHHCRFCGRLVCKRCCHKKEQHTAAGNSSKRICVACRLSTAKEASMGSSDQPVEDALAVAEALSRSLSGNAGAPAFPSLDEPLEEPLLRGSVQQKSVDDPRDGEGGGGCCGCCVVS